MTPVIAIFDVGKTNKKLLLFDAEYRVVFEEQTQWEEILDDDGFHGDDLDRLTTWLRTSLDAVLADSRFLVKAVNFAAYGASLVHLNDEGQPLTPLYNYLKPFPEDLHREFYGQFGSPEFFCAETASPDLGMLNSGLQLYWLKHVKPWIFRQIEHSLHLPQYASFALTGRPVAEITSIGCHTALWNFGLEKYHRWVFDEGLHSLGQMVLPSFVTVKRNLTPRSPLLLRGGESFLRDTPSQQERGPGGEVLEIGVGMHDSSAALVPYLMAFDEPFLLLSTGTWCIAMNPFSQEPLTVDELRRDCLSYLNFRGEPVKASRLFAGNEHERRVKWLSEYFGLPTDFYKHIGFDAALVASLRGRFVQARPEDADLGSLRDSAFADRNLNEFADATEAYHQLLLDLMAQQIASIRLARGGTAVTKLFVDGGFSRSPIYMHLLAEAFPDLDVYASELAQATALGAALVIAPSWNARPFGRELFKLKKFTHPVLS